MNQQHDMRDLHRYVKGELYTNGWMSDWRRELIRRSAEEASKPVKKAA